MQRTTKVRGLAAVLAGSGLVLGAMAPSAAQASCEDVTIIFGVRLVQPSPTESAVVAVDIPEGVYDVVLVSGDERHPGAADQPDETWALVLDSYTSPAAPDLPSSETSQSATVAVAANIPASSTAQAVHTGVGLSPGSVDAIHAVLVCQSAVTPTTVEPTTTVAPTTTQIDQGFTRTTQPAPTTTTTTDDGDVGDLGVTAPSEPPPTTGAGSTGGEELAATGASTSLALTLLGGALIASGTALYAVSREEVYATPVGRLRDFQPRSSSALLQAYRRRTRS